MLNQCIDSLVQKVQNGVVINFEKIGPDPPPITEKADDSAQKDESGGKDSEFTEQGERVSNQPANTSWYNCRRMIYVPRAAQKGYPLGGNQTEKKNGKKLLKLSSLSRFLANSRVVLAGCDRLYAAPTDGTSQRQIRLFQFRSDGHRESAFR